MAHYQRIISSSPEGIKVLSSHRDSTSEADAILQSLPPINGDRVLDLGCNAGYFAFRFAELGAYVVAVDKDPSFLKETELFRSKFPNSENVSFIHQDLDVDPPSGSFKVVLCLSLLRHLRSPTKALQNLRFSYLVLRDKINKFPPKRVNAIVHQLGATHLTDLKCDPRYRLSIFRRPYLVVVLSTSASGQSLLTSLLDAHPQMAFSRELSIPHVRRKFPDATLQALIARIKRNSEFYSQHGRPHYASGQNHLVPGASNGRVDDPLLAFGDKHGVGISNFILSPTLRGLDILESFGANLKFIVNRRDEAPHWADFQEGWRWRHEHNTRKIFETMIKRRESACELVKSRGYTPLEVRYEDLCTRTESVLGEILDFLEVPNPPWYSRACSKIIKYPCPVKKNLRPGKWYQFI